MKLLTTREFSNYLSPIDFYEAKNREDSFWLTAGQIGEMLGYGEPEKAIKKIHTRNSRDFEGLYIDDVEVNVRRKGIIKTTVYNFEGALKLCALSHKFRAPALIGFLCDSKIYLANFKASQKSGLQVLDYENSQIRVIRNDKNELWWIAADVCEVLGISNSRDAVSSLDDDEKADVGITDGSQKRHMNIINESGLYNLIFKSNKPEAKKFKRWITHEVIPSIRKTGSYTITKKPKTIEERIDKKKTHFCCLDTIAKDLGLGIGKVEYIAASNKITGTYGFMKGNSWYVTEEGRDKLLELL